MTKISLMQWTKRLGLLMVGLILPSCSWYHEFYDDSFLVEKNAALFNAKQKLVEDIGIEKKGGLLHVILKRGAKTPCAEALVLAIQKDPSSPSLNFKLYRGLSPKVSGDVLMGEFQVLSEHLLPGTQVHLSLGAGEGKVLLEAKNLSTGERLKIVRKNQDRQP
jgi:hypothetical protein